MIKEGPVGPWPVAMGLLAALASLLVPLPAGAESLSGTLDARVEVIAHCAAATDTGRLLLTGCPNFTSTITQPWSSPSPSSERSAMNTSPVASERYEEGALTYLTVIH